MAICERALKNCDSPTCDVHGTRAEQPTDATLPTDAMITAGMLADRLRPLVLASCDGEPPNRFGSSCLNGTPMIPLHRATVTAVYEHLERLALIDGEMTDRAREYPISQNIPDLAMQAAARVGSITPEQATSANRGERTEGEQAAAPTPNGEGVGFDTFIERTRAALEDVTRRVKKLSRHNSVLLGQCIDDALAALLRARPDNLDTLAAATPINSEGLDALFEKVERLRQFVELRRRVASPSAFDEHRLISDLESAIAALEAVRAGDGR